jgi:ABC-type Fe3+/spermidine/putrescine transport system ATPase subunit/phenylacetate-coenzyme A ligase PaaK-like adenylate-forming protein
MLRITRLVKRYTASGTEVRAVDAVDLEVGTGEFLALLGPSGCGKTTMLRLVAGLEAPDEGEIELADRVVSAPGRGVAVPAFARDIGMVFQSYAIWPHLDVFENVAYPLRVQRPRVARGEIDAWVGETLALVGMETAARRRATALSGGQQQRVALARALVRRPSLLLLDEPLSNLDARLREQMQREIADLVRRLAITTLYVTHDQAEAFAMADRIAVMDAGRIVQSGAAAEIAANPANTFVAEFLRAGEARTLSTRANRATRTTAPPRSPSLPDYLILDPALERMPADELRRLQSDRLRRMVEYVYEATPFWRTKLDAARVKPSDVGGLEDLARLPFVTRAELEADQAAHPPFGSYLAVDSRRLWRFMATSGTTGRPLRRVFSRRDWEYVLDRFERRARVEPGDVSVVLGPIDGLLGPMAGAEAAARAGALVVLAGLADSRGKVALVRDLRPTTVTGSASYLLHLAEIARESGVDLPALGIRTVVSVGEPGAAVPATRLRIAEAWGAAVVDGYGLTELFPLASGCPDSTALHIASDFVITEIVHPETGAPVAPGEPGEVVYTNLVGETQPLLRYRTRDIARLAVDGPCTCGFTGARLAQSIEGRADDMIWYRGANLFPSAIEAIVRTFPELGDEYEIVLTRAGALPDLAVRVEKRDGHAGSPEDVARRVGEALAAALRLQCRLEVLPYGSLTRADAQAKRRRVIREDA